MEDHPTFFEIFSSNFEAVGLPMKDQHIFDFRSALKEGFHCYSLFLTGRVNTPQAGCTGVALALLSSHWNIHPHPDMHAWVGTCALTCRHIFTHEYNVYESVAVCVCVFVCECVCVCA